MNTISPIPATSGTAEQAVPEAVTPVQAAPPPAAFASIHTLLRRVDALDELNPGACYIRNKNGILEPWNTERIPTDKLLPLVENGRLYTVWDHRYLEFDELTPDWPKAQRAPVATTPTPTPTP